MKTYVIECTELDSLIDSIKCLGFKVIGPVLQDSAIIYSELQGAENLPAGWTDEQTNGTYRLKRRDDAAIFGWNVGPQSWKKYLFPPVQKLFSTIRSAREQDDSSAKKQAQQKSAHQKYAFFGVRPCDLNAISRQDKIFLGGQFVDPNYEQNRNGSLIVAVNCTQAGGTCFCASMNTGPRATGGFDLALTEILEENRHYFLTEVCTELGREVLKKVKCHEATELDISKSVAATAKASGQMGRSLNTADLKNILYQNFENPRWERTAGICLSCANCTMVCPTCFCATVEDETDLAGARADRTRKWDSCFSLDFSYIHGGSVRRSVKSRYRQWLTHKFASWVDQFGTFGCVGCGRCITWCPVGIDITEELRVIRENQA